MKFVSLFFYLCTLACLTAQNHTSNELFGIDSQAEKWIDSTYSGMSLEAKIAQLFWIAIEKPEDASQFAQNQELIEKYQPGGIIFFKTQADRLVSTSNHYQSISKIPMLVAIDAEWGLGMRLDSCMSFPYQMTLGAMANDSLLFEMGQEVGRQLKDIGIHVNFAPVVDVNNNANNPVIGKRSFGEMAVNVAKKASLYAQGMQSEGIIAVAKHFPGHGDTDVDSHHALPLITHSKERLDSVELLPFRYLIQDGVMGVMTAHLNVPGLDPDPKKPSSTSKVIVSDLLKDKMQFKGLVITDAVNMRGISNYDQPGIVDLKCLRAGNDVVEFTKDLPLAIHTVKSAIEEGRFSIQELEDKCKKVLAAKYWCGLSDYKSVSFNKVTHQNKRAQALNRHLYANAITVLNNRNSILPFNNLETLQVHAICFNNIAEWKNNLWRYKSVEIKNKTYIDSLSVNTNDEVLLLLIEDKATLKKHKKQFDFILNTHKCVIVYGGIPYDLGQLNDLDKAEAVVLTYQNNSITRDLVAQLLFGAIPASGTLPVTINSKYKAGDGIFVPSLGRLRYTLPEEGGLDSEWINHRVDSIVNAGLKMKAFPACHIFVVYDQKVIFNKAYGFHTYEKRTKVGEHDVYDLASVTKISGPLPLIMKACELDLIDLDKPFADVWPDWKRGLLHPSNKSDITFRQVLAHQAGLLAYINYYPLTMKEGKYRRKYYRITSGSKHAIKISDHMYLSSDFKKRVYKEIRRSPLLKEHKYKYSGLSFMLYPELLTKVFGQDYEKQLYKTFFDPLGASSLCYSPLNRMSKGRILPTEYDKHYRKMQVRGMVHDEAAAVMGGISGNAGLFSSANDLAKLMQMYMQMGEYAGKRYIDRAIFEEFIKVQFPESNNRRALGFDKPLFGNDLLSIEKSYPAPGVSASSFGHSGFTGTFVWMDPEYDLVYIFLSNRVYPSRNNRLIYQHNIRPSIQQVFYDAIKNKEP